MMLVVAAVYKKLKGIRPLIGTFPSIVKAYVVANAVKYIAKGAHEEHETDT
ncbi:hypothetical protein [Paenibacillus sp. DMB20]|uniref:hypothetical protein n=1 Tax=Paenibacillus sp. DMB20 TaxID=1642570 RepID=UPI000AAC906E|nr:hypothetical protein [Paenibacillus sp. DMB20]